MQLPVPKDEYDFLGPDARLLVRNGSCAVYQFENETGNGIVTAYEVFPGVQLLYSDFHLEKITEPAEFLYSGDSEILTINHCREGRYECEFPQGECAYIGDGDLAVSQVPTLFKSSSYPLSHYHGISIMLDIPRASETLERIFASLGAPSIDVRSIREKLLGQRPYFLVRRSDAVDHIFSELYHVPDSLKESYIKLKLIELLLFLSIANPLDSGERRYFYKTKVDTVKAMCAYMTANLDKRFTLQELSERFDIPLTAMKNCFKSVFGSPVHSYMRDYRLQKASALLRETDEPVARIAAKVGYDSHTQFSAAFKSRTGMAPSDYRKVAVQKG